MQRSLMALVVVEITGTLVFMLKLAVPPPAKGDKGGITTNPLLATARFDQWDPLTATEATMLASNRFGFHPVVSHGLSSLPRHAVVRVDLPASARLYCLASAFKSHEEIVALDLGCKRRTPTAMSAASKVKYSRQRWKQKAKSRADDNRYLRKELERLKRERDAYKKRAKQAEAQLRVQPPAALRPAIERKVDLVHVTLELFVRARISFRAVSRVLGVLAAPLGLAKAPCPQTVINWVTRLSITRLQQASTLPKNLLSADPFANGFIWIIDISIALGSGKLLAVLALDARHHARQASAPGLEHVHPLAASVAESWTGEAVAEVLKELIGTLGRPVALLKDGGSELAKAADELSAEALGTRCLDDLSHVAANLLKHPYVHHPHFDTFLSACGQVSKHLKQSALACLAPPKTSTKARFMNLHRLVKWADQLLQHCRPGAARAGSALAKLRSALDQLPTCKAFIGLFRRDAETLLQCQEVLKVKGLSEQTREQCHQIVEAMPPSSPVRRGFEAWMAKHLAVASELGLDTVGLPISSDPIESLFGVVKQRSQGPIKDADRLAVYLPAFCGQRSQGDAAHVLEISVAQQQEVMGTVSSLSKQRRQVLPRPGSLESLFEADRPRHVELLAGSKNRSKSAIVSTLSNGYELVQGTCSEVDDEGTLPLNSVLAGASRA